MNRKLIFTLVAAATGAGLVACVADDANDSENKEISFTEISPSITEAEKNAIRSTTEVTIGGEMQYIDYRQFSAAAIRATDLASPTRRL